MSYKFRNFIIPDYMLPGIARYIEKGIPPGQFLQAVICNDLLVAVQHADDINVRNLVAYAGYFYNKAPAGCWGSPAKYAEWVALSAEARTAIIEASEYDPRIKS
jgi:hypothetical protein